MMGNRESLVGKSVKIVVSEQDKFGKEFVKIIYGVLLEESEFSLKVRDDHGKIVVIGMRNLSIMTERREQQ